MSSDFEAELGALDARLEKAQKAAENLVKGLKRVRRSAREGAVSDIVRGLSGLDARLADAQSAARGLAEAWRFDAPAYMADGRFLADLQRAAGEHELKLFERDGRIYCFPLILRLEANLDLVFRTYRRLAGRQWNATGAGPVVALIDIHDTLTLMPNADYPREEFARDLLLIDRRPDTRTRTGERFEFPHGTTTKGIRPLIVYDEDGAQRAYYGIRFVQGE